MTLAELMNDLVGIKAGESNAAYHSGPGVSFSAVKEFMRYPAAYKYYLNKAATRSTRSQDLGTWTHMAILEPQLLNSSITLVSGPMNKNPWKAEADAIKLKGGTPVGIDTWEQIVGMRDAVNNHPVASKLLQGSKNEHSCYAVEPTTGLLIKCRPDIMRLDINTLGDIKTIDSVDKAIGQIRRMKYAFQSAWYLRVMSLITGETWKNMVHVFVETKAPYGVKCVALGDETLARCNSLIDQTLADIAKCTDDGVWPGPANDEIETVEVQYFDMMDGE
jgi:hypothetical protein